MQATIDVRGAGRLQAHRGFIITYTIVGGGGGFLIIFIKAPISRCLYWVLRGLGLPPPHGR